MTKAINKPNDYITHDVFIKKLEMYATKDDVEVAILKQKIDTKASK